MEIEVRLYGALQKYRPGSVEDSGPFKLEVPDGITVSEVADQLGIPKGWLRTAFVNEQASKKDRVLQEGDKVALLPPAGGG